MGGSSTVLCRRRRAGGRNRHSGRSVCKAYKSGSLTSIFPRTKNGRHKSAPHWTSRSAVVAARCSGVCGRIPARRATSPHRRCHFRSRDIYPHWLLCRMQRAWHCAGAWISGKVTIRALPRGSSSAWAGGCPWHCHPPCTAELCDRPPSRTLPSCRTCSTS